MGEVIYGDFGKKNKQEKPDFGETNELFDEQEEVIYFNREAFIEKIETRKNDKQFVLRIGKEKLEAIIHEAKQLAGFARGSWKVTNDDIEGKGAESLYGLLANVDAEDIKKRPTLYIRALAKLMD